MNEKQQQLTFDKGITNVPSDALCSDNALEESLGMIYEDGEHRVIQRPVTLDITIDGSLKYIHKGGNFKNYIYLDADKMWCWMNEDGGGKLYLDGATGTQAEAHDPQKVMITQIGQTLIIADDVEMRYYLWKVVNESTNAFGYYGLGSDIPEPNIQFSLSRYDYNGYNPADSEMQDVFGPPVLGPEVSMKCNTFLSCSRSTDSSNVVHYRVDVTEGEEQTYKDAVIGLYSELKHTIARRKSFCEPFVIRYALELYDGTYTRQSAPIIMFPAVTTNMGCWVNEMASTHYLKMKLGSLYLNFEATYDYSDWNDIVKDVVIFVSDGVSLYDTTGKQEPRKYDEVDLKVQDYIIDYVESTGGDLLNPVYTYYHRKYKEVTCTARAMARDYNIYNFVPLRWRMDSEILEDICNTSIFYKLCSIGPKHTGTLEPASKYIKSNILTTLTEQEQLRDDYHSHCPLLPSFLYTYNSRLILADVYRGFYKGASTFLPYWSTNNYPETELTLLYRVYLKTSSGIKVIENTLTTKEIPGLYFFYPDPRAYKVMVYSVGSSNNSTTYSLIKSMDLKEHTGLNGAYYFDALPNGTETVAPASAALLPDAANETYEHLYNELHVSEVNNPFVFNAEGNITVGNGTILGVSSLTQALSEGQFGQYPLIIFTTEGIWAASTGVTGLFTAVHPMSREVCNNSHSITQTDGAIFFTSAKGLMLIIGSQVKCVSEQMSGRENVFSGESSMGTFSNFLKNCFIAYDYRDSLLWIFNSNNTTCYVYSIKSGTFGRYAFSNAIAYTVNDYPDYLLQQGTTVYSLMQRPDINADTAYNYAARIITRPMKLENALALKSIMQIRHILQFNPYTITETWEDPETHLPMESETTQKGTMTLRIFASNNLDNWVELHSLRGTPWKYYRFRFDFSNMKATDRFAGTMLITQERRTNKLR